MDNFKAANDPLCEGDIIAGNELRIDEGTIKCLSKADLELEPETTDCPKGTTDSPENLQKDICDGAGTSNDVSSSSNSCIATPVAVKSLERDLFVAEETANDTESAETKSKSAAGLAFTIEFNEGKAADNKKHREIMERFQNRQQQQLQQRRHKRGVSLSKLDDTMRSSLPLGTSIDDISTGVVSKPPFKEKQALSRGSRMHQSVDSDRESIENIGVVLRRRPHNIHQSHLDGSDSSVGNKRHSWSPRTSLKDEVVTPAAHHHRPEPLHHTDNGRKKGPVSSFLPKSATLQRALESQPRGRRAPSPKPKHIAEAKLDVISTPLEYVKLSDDAASADAVSEAGTYTLDGDHYTEEEKERMSIDKESALFAQKHGVNIGPKGLKASMSLETTSSRNEKNKRMKNMSEKTNVSTSTASSAAISQLSKHTPTPVANSHKVSYLEKIKSRVKTIGDSTFHKLPLSRNTRASSETPTSGQRTDDEDVGTFTSVTACGVLNKSSNPSVRKHRKNSLTKLQIDASEYIQPNFKTDENMMKSYTDYEKAKQNEYQLNIFSTASSASQVEPEPYGFDNNSAARKSVSIKTAPTKNDWIQEWARNARRRNILLSAGTGPASTASSASSRLPEQNGSVAKKAQLPCQMSRSDDFVQSYRHAQSSSEFGDDTNPDAEDNSFLEESSHPRVQQIQANSGVITRKQTSSSVTTRPPVSPTKIPSPLHSSVRVRGTSANRSFRSSFSVSYYLYLFVIICRHLQHTLHISNKSVIDLDIFVIFRFSLILFQLVYHF